MKKIIYVIPGVEIAGGIAVVFQHANRLKKRDYNVILLNIGKAGKVDWFDVDVEIVHWRGCKNRQSLLDDVDIAVATHHTTVDFVDLEIDAVRKVYFVQSDERRFHYNYNLLDLCQKTYEKDTFEYMTEAVWIQRWLKEEFGYSAYFVPNGLDETLFYETSPLAKRNKKRVLIEGPINTPIKGMKDAYNALTGLDCDIWIISADMPEKGWAYDRYFNAVPMHQMRDIYSSCDIFLKMSRVEGFFGPPLEAMACGCAVVVSKCTGYDEYIVNEKNALVVEKGDIFGAREAVKKLLTDESIKQRLVEEGKKTAQEWSWERSIDFLESMIKEDAVEVFYNDNFPERYDYNLVMRNMYKESAKKHFRELKKLKSSLFFKRDFCIKYMKKIKSVFKRSPL